MENSNQDSQANGQAVTMDAPAISNEIKKVSTKTPVSVRRVMKQDYDKEGQITAELEQVIKTKSYYPSKQISTNMSGNVFDMADFDQESHKPKEYEATETRVAWISVPEGTTEEVVAEKLAAKPGACLYRVLGNSPVITDAQQYAINSNITTLDVFANRQAIRYPEGAKVDGQDVSGKLILDNAGKIQYRAVFFWPTQKEDSDLRNADAQDFYLSPELEDELNGGNFVQRAQTI